MLNIEPIMKLQIKIVTRQQHTHIATAKNPKPHQMQANVE